MTPKEVIEWLEAIEEKYIHGGDESFDEKRKTAINNAISALEKQIPKKPIEDGYYGEQCVCPNCGSNVINEADNDCQFNYCYHCGQALDWSDDNG